MAHARITALEAAPGRLTLDEDDWTYVQQGLAANTRGTYASAIKRFLAFCDRLNIPLHDRIPASEILLIKFVSFLAKEKLKPGSINTYLVGVRSAHVDAGLGNPLEGKLLLRRALRGVFRVHGTPRQPRYPVTIDILRRICAANTGDPWEDRLFAAAATLGFYGFLRAGEFVIKARTYNASVHPAVGDVAFHVKDTVAGQALRGFEFTIKASKTDQFRVGSKIFIGVGLALPCPVIAMASYAAPRAHLPDTAPSSPLFVHADGTIFTHAQFINALEQRLCVAGIPVAGFSGHSFRIGAATTAAAAGVEDSLIRAMGRWRSDCYRTYIHTPVDTLMNVSARMASANIAPGSFIFDPFGGGEPDIVF